MATTETTEDKLTIHRVEHFVELGFDDEVAFTLAECKGVDGFSLYWGDVAKMLKNGATHAQVLDIFKPL